METADPVWCAAFIGSLDIVKQGILPDSSVLGVLWSVAIEEQFYLFWPLLLLLFMRFRQALYLAFIVLTILFRFKYADSPMTLEFHTISVISDMAIGGMLADYCLRKSTTFNGLKWLHKWHIALVYALMICTIIFKDYLFETPVAIAAERLVLSLFFAFIIFEQNYAANSLFKMGKLKWLSNWGKYTYGRYCLHFIGILIALRITSTLGLNTSIWGVLFLDTLLVLVLSMALAWLSYHLMEKHFLKLKNKFPNIQKSD